MTAAEGRRRPGPRHRVGAGGGRHRDGGARAPDRPAERDQHRHGRDHREGIGGRGRRDPARRRVRDRRRGLAGQPAQQGIGFLLRVPAIDIAEIGAGGGSIVRVDDAGQLHVGPRSAGAIPGPACYAQGGKEATLTDANVVLGYLHPERLPSGLRSTRTWPARAVAGSGGAAARPRSRRPRRTASTCVGCARMARAVRAVTIERGRDAREFAMVAFGGNGPLFAAEMARSLGIGTVLVPPAPGVFSAVGLLEADIEHHLVRTFLRPLDGRDGRRRWRRPSGRSRGRPRPCSGRRATASRWRWTGFVDLKYAGPVVRADDPAARPTGGAAAGVRCPGRGLRRGARADVWPRRGGRSDPVVNLRAHRPARAARRGGAGAAAPSERAAPASGTRRAYFGREHGSLATPVLGRADLDATPAPGPAPDRRVRRHDARPAAARPPASTSHGNILIATTGRRDEIEPPAAARPDPPRADQERPRRDRRRDGDRARCAPPTRPTSRPRWTCPAPLCDAEGRLIAQGLTLPLHLGSIPDAMREVRTRSSTGSIQPGRRVPAQRPVPGRHAPARLLPPQADLRRRATCRLVGEHRPPDRRRRQDRRAATAATRPRSSRRACASRRSSSTTGASRPRRSSRFSPRTCACRTRCWATCAPQVAACLDRRARLPRAGRALRRASGFAACTGALLDQAERLARNAITAMPDGVYHVHRLHRRRRHRPRTRSRSWSPSRSRATG